MNCTGHITCDKLYRTVQELGSFLESARKARRLNSHVFSMLRARFPQEDKLAAMVKQSGTVVPRIRFPSTPSAFDTLPAKGTIT
jgi:cytoplasmic FMR1 interacting protein